MPKRRARALWAPWRMEYIAGPRAPGCFLCAMLRRGGDREGLVVFRGRRCAVVLNRYPYNNGHLMVAPRRHVPDLRAMTRAERAEAMDLLDRAIAALRAAVRPDGFNVGLNLGKAAGAGLEGHVHFHVVPRWNGDTNFMPVVADVKVIPQALAELCAVLRRAF